MSTPPAVLEEPDPDSDEDDFGDGRYVRAPSEYVRPPRRYLLQVGAGETSRSEVTGVFAYNDVLETLAHGQILELELVPEPGNPWDSQAVSVELDSKRIGYLNAGLATDWHDCLRFLNGRGYAGYVPGVARRSRTDHVWVSLGIPNSAALLRFARNIGVFAECDAILSEFDSMTLDRMIEQADDLPEDLASRAESLKDLAPGLSWSVDMTLTPFERLPQAIVLRLNDLAMTKARARRQSERNAREKAKEEKRQERGRVLAEKTRARARLRESVRSQTIDGLSQREIAGALDCTISMVSKLQKEAGVRPAGLHNPSHHSVR